MNRTSAADYYDQESVIERYSGHGQRGFFQNERTVVERYFTNADGRVLDLGCGTGRTTVRLAELGFDVVGVDVCEPMIQEARRLFPDVEFRVGDATALDYDDDAFDYVLFSFLGIDDIQPESARIGALREVMRVLAPGGLFAFSANNAVNRYLFNPLDADAWRAQARFLWRNFRAGQFGSHYKYREYFDGDGLTYSITPLAQRRQLRAVGFDAVDVVKRASRPTVVIEPRPYYVAQKAPAPRDAASVREN